VTPEPAARHEPVITPALLFADLVGTVLIAVGVLALWGNFAPAQRLLGEPSVAWACLVAGAALVGYFAVAVARRAAARSRGR